MSIEDLEKAWPKHYDRVKGQTKDKGVSSQKQLRYMKAKAGEGDKDAKAYVRNSDSADLPEDGTGGMRGEREKHRAKKKSTGKKDKTDKDVVSKSDDPGTPIKACPSCHFKMTTANSKYIGTSDVSSVPGYEGKQMAQYNCPKCDSTVSVKEDKAEKAAKEPDAVRFRDQVKDIKAKYKSKKSKTFNEQVANVKDRYKEPTEKSSELFYGKIEGLLEKGFQNETLISHLMDVELLLRNNSNTSKLNELYKMADRLFDASMSQEEQTVYELSYLAKNGDDEAYGLLIDFSDEMTQELLKHSSIKDVINSLIKKKKISMDADELIDEHKNLINVLRSPSHKDDKEEAKEQSKELKEYKQDRANKSADNSKVKGKMNGESYRMVSG